MKTWAKLLCFFLMYVIHVMHVQFINQNILHITFSLRWYLRNKRNNKNSRYIHLQVYSNCTLLYLFMNDTTSDHNMCTHMAYYVFNITFFSRLQCFLILVFHWHSSVIIRSYNICISHCVSNIRYFSTDNWRQTVLMK